jgi:adenylate kinase
MRLILVGPPGSGKGTQARLLSKRVGLTHISTGDILREAGRQATQLGLMARAYMDRGLFVPDELVNDLISERFRRDDRPERFVMDGYPRTRLQALAFQQVLDKHDLPLTAVVLLVVSEKEVLRRLTGRWSCPTCKRVYHVLNNPPHRPGYCDDDGTALVQRVDDLEATVRERLRVYHEMTLPMVELFRQQRLLLEVPAEGEIEVIYQTMMNNLNQAKSLC